MDLMKYLGFSKKKADNGKEAPAENNASFVLTDRYPRAEGEARIFNLIVLDESGSMGPIRAQAFNGANETIRIIRTAQHENADDRQMLTFVTFDQASDRKDIRVLVDNQRIEEVKDLNWEQYRPNGMTPLYDAMGISINALQKHVKEGDNVLVTVITDGAENASHIYTAEMIKELVASLNSKGWTFTYIGANQDSEQAAYGLGINSSMDFEASPAGTGMMYDRMNSSRRAYYKKVHHS